MIKSFNTRKILHFNRIIQPWLDLIVIIFWIVGLTFALWISPPDYQQFETVRIMYIHVPAAWFSMAFYGSIGLLGLIGFVSGNRLYHVMAQALAPIGLCFTLICLGTGMIWGKPIWGTWWVWDARLTSMAILAFMYVSYLMACTWTELEVNNNKLSSIIAMIGCINLPIIKWSVDWWNTLHQPASVLRLSGPTLHSSMLYPLLIMAIAYSLLAFSLWLRQTETLIIKQKIKRTEILQRYQSQ